MTKRLVKMDFPIWVADIRTESGDEFTYSKCWTEKPTETEVKEEIEDLHGVAGLYGEFSIEKIDGTV